jgi:hypothetical protein
MPDATTNETAPTTASAESQATGAAADKNNASQARPGGKTSAAGPRLAAAATIDELLAKEALANLRRNRASARIDTAVQAACTILPATIVVVVTVTSMDDALYHACRDGRHLRFLCAGGIAYLFMRPPAVATTSDAELRNIRESMAQLRRMLRRFQMSWRRTAQLSTLRTRPRATAWAVSSKVSIALRDQSASATKIERLSEQKAQFARTVPAAPSAEITGTVQPQQPPPPPRPARDARSSPDGTRRAYGSPFSRESRDRSRPRPGCLTAASRKSNTKRPLAGLHQLKGVIVLPALRALVRARKTRQIPQFVAPTIFLGVRSGFVPMIFPHRERQALGLRQVTRTVRTFQSPFDLSATPAEVARELRGLRRASLALQIAAICNNR